MILIKEFYIVRAVNTIYWILVFLFLIIVGAIMVYFRGGIKDWSLYVFELCPRLKYFIPGRKLSKSKIYIATTKTTPANKIGEVELSRVQGDLLNMDSIENDSFQINNIKEIG